MKLNLNRRHFLAGAAGLALASRAARAAVPTLTARPGKVRIVPGDYPETAIWGYDGGVPGPEIRLRKGERLTRQLVNELPQATTVHWHGLRIPNAMDGVPGLTQAAVDPGGNFLYDFTPPDAGTFWYHSHNRSTEQVERGLYGLLIVEETEPPEVDRDLSVVVDDWRLTEDAALADEFGQMRDWTHGGRIGNFVNAVVTPRPAGLKRHERLRLRLVNTATDRVMVIGLHGMEGAIVALDGMPLIAPEAADVAVLGPAERADFIVDVTAQDGEPAIIAIHEGEEAFVLAEFPVEGSHAAAPRGPIPVLPPNPLTPLASADGARDVPLAMEGGAMGGLREGTYNGERMSIQDLVEKGQVWTLNGVAGLPEAPLVEAAKGELIRIPMQNDTAFPHAMHLHGHHFQEVLPDGSLGPRRDTLTVARGETRNIVFRADNPGDWLLHCHMLSHQAAGMKTWLRVTV
ncbi:MAG: multicopper oxidase family protein [Maritimibacter sp.]|nr:multicopper oxidase family protein [Maritimibacter sp.]